MVLKPSLSMMFSMSFPTASIFFLMFSHPFSHHCHEFLHDLPSFSPWEIAIVVFLGISQLEQVCPTLW